MALERDNLQRNIKLKVCNDIYVKEIIVAK